MTNRSTAKEKTIITKKMGIANTGLLDKLRDRVRRKYEDKCEKVKE